jgi:hypothetical protein
MHPVVPRFAGLSGTRCVMRKHQTTEILKGHGTPGPLIDSSKNSEEQKFWRTNFGFSEVAQLDRNTKIGTRPNDSCSTYTALWRAGGVIQ